MAIKIKFDSNYNVEQPTFVLAHRNGKFIGKLPICNLQFKDTLSSGSEARFDLYKMDMPDNKTIGENIKISAFDICNTLSSNSGNVRVGQITENKYNELYRYFNISEKISSPIIRIKKGTNNEVRLNNLKLSINETTLIIADSNGTTIFYINSNYYIYMVNPSSLSYSADDFLKIDFSFNVPSAAVDNMLWEQVKDFKLVWAKEWNELFEIKVDFQDSGGIKKSITSTSLGEAELSQIYLYKTEINTENDILRDNYEPAILFNETNHNASLLHRILEKAPHYSVSHIDSTIANIQRTFSFDGKSIYDALQEIEQEINCIFIIKCYIDSNGKIKREISAYDLETNCLSCGHRGEYTSVCEECGSNNIITGFGQDTTIFVTSENLAENIDFTTDTGSVKNCFKLQGGDDLMTATIMNCNPNGSPYIWYISDDVKEDMSAELVSKLNDYNELYNYYQNEYELTPNSTLRTAYNNLINKYYSFNDKLTVMPSAITGYPALMKEYYNTIDLFLYLNDTLMPNVELSSTNAGLEAAKLNYANLSPVAVSNLETCSLSTANSAVLAMAKTLVNPNYQVKITDSTFADSVWIGDFTVTHYSDDTDTYSVSSIHVNINENYEDYVRQRLEKSLSNKSEDILSIVSLFNADTSDFTNELKKYSLSMLNEFHDACEACLNILIEQGISDKKTWADKDPDMYKELYSPYYSKLGLIESEIQIRETEIATIIGTYNRNGELTSNGIQTILKNQQKYIQNTLNFENYLGETLWLEFIAYRREDTYENSNYISDGLDNAELFQNALRFIEVAKKDIFKSATRQHSISASLKNFLVMKEFQPIVNNFEIGNWLRIKVDNLIYQLRLIEYTIDFEKLDSLSITFSDVKIAQNGLTDISSILDASKSMATSYNSVSHQAEKGNKSNEQLSNWVNNGLSLTKMKIVDNANNQNITWDEHGLLCKEYLPITDSYDDRQLKIINRGLYVTDNNWLTSRAGIGNFEFFNPETMQFEESYGVIADTLIGNLILSEKVGIYNTENSVKLDRDGLTITTEIGGNGKVMTIQRKEEDENNQEITVPIMYLDADGNLVLTGSVMVQSGTNEDINTLDDACSISRFDERINNKIMEESQNIYNSVDSRYSDILNEVTEQLESYKADIGQYMEFNEDGLTLGATSSSFKTVIDNEGMYFKQNDTIVAYINNNLLYIPNAVIQQTLCLGKFFFNPRSDGGVSLVWGG